MVTIILDIKSIFINNVAEFHLKILVAFTIFFVWIKTLAYTRILEATSFYLRTIIQSFKDMRWFIFILFMLL